MRKLKTSDLFSLSRIFKKMDIKDEIKTLTRDITGLSEEEKIKISQELQVNLSILFIENIGNAEKEVYKLFASLTDKTAEEIENMDLDKFFKLIQELFNQEGFENFFIQSTQIEDEFECMDLLLTRYKNIDYVMDMDLEEGIEIINTAYKKKAEEMLWQRWLVDYSNMDKEHFIPFTDYKNKVFKDVNITENNNKVSKESIEETAKKAIEEAERIKKADQKGGST
ncbi:hypothetical protein AC231_04655 [Clostridium pasteurianum]|nr:hypothetical protein [Clostridium pasteurianum]OMH20081.1 hypothetical protein AC231_04655 [Clostridium pasteurianum]